MFGCLSAYWDTHTLECGPVDLPTGVAWRPPTGVGLETLLPPSGCGPGDPPGCGPGDHPGADSPQEKTPRGQTDTCKNITFANFVCGR